MSGIPKNVQSFIFRYLDSVDQLEILQCLAKDRSRRLSAMQLTNELRSNQSSIERHLAHLVSIGLIEEGEGGYLYHPKDMELEKTINDLMEVSKIRRHRVLELIYSPLKKTREFGDAFRLNMQNDKDEGNNG